jgi:hypothetical protein
MPVSFYINGFYEKHSHRTNCIRTVPFNIRLQQQSKKNKAIVKNMQGRSYLYESGWITQKPGLLAAGHNKGSFENYLYWGAKRHQQGRADSWKREHQSPGSTDIEQF